jgi:hypothetical protein
MIELFVAGLGLLVLLVWACIAVCRHCLREMAHYEVLSPWR